MKALVRLALLLTIPCLAVSTAQSQASGNQPSGANLQVSLVTAGPGTAMFEWFGHSGILVGNLTTGEQRFYEYGVFSSGPKAAFRVIMGNPVAGVWQLPAPVAMARFTAAGRRVDIQKLALTNAQKLELLNRLEVAVSPAHRSQSYRLLTANCATRPRDLIDAVTSGSLAAAGRKGSATTLRQNGLALPMPFLVKLLMDFTFNNDVDRRETAWEAAALPGKLEELARSAMVRGENNIARPLVADSWSFGKESAGSGPVEDGLEFLIVGVALSAIALSALVVKSPRISRTISAITNVVLGFVIGLPGALLLLGWVFTDNDFVFHNANLFIANPALIAAIPLGVAIVLDSEWSHRWTRRLWISSACLGAVGLIEALIASHSQDNLRFYGFLLPLIAAQALVEWRRASSSVKTVHERRTTTLLLERNGVTNGANDVESHAAA